jgi:tetratricopeptide (TPR) repeat protein
MQNAIRAISAVIVLCAIVAARPAAAAPHEPDLQALAKYNTVLELDPDNVSALRARGSTLRALELYDDALRDLERVEVIAAGDPETLCEIGICYYMLGETDRALGFLLDSEEAVAQGMENGTLDREQYGPVEQELRETLLAIFRERGEFEKSFEQCTKLEQYLAGKLSFKCDKADLLIALGRAEEALELYEEVVEWNEVFERFCVGAANCYLLTGYTAKALEVFEKWAAADPATPLPWMFRSIVLKNHLDRPEEALRASEEALRLANAAVSAEELFDFEDLVILARVHQAAGRFAESARVLDGLMEYGRGHYLVVQIQAANYRALGRIEEAESMEREAALYKRLNPRDWLQAYAVIPPGSTAPGAEAASSGGEPSIEGERQAPPAPGEEEDSGGFSREMTGIGVVLLFLAVLAVLILRRKRSNI